MVYFNIGNDGYVISYTDSVVEGYVPLKVRIEDIPTGVRLRISGNALVSEQFPEEWAALRREAYPPIGDQLDALWKLIQANSDKIDLGEAATLLAAVQEVKSKYPKE